MHRHYWAKAVVVLLVGLCMRLFIRQSAVAAAASPADTVRAFYVQHFAQGLAFTEENIAAKARWLAPELYVALIAELRKPGAPDEAPRINGDPFTDTQEYPASFEIQSSEETSHAATVTVHFALPVGVRIVRVLLTRLEFSWRISDFVYEDSLSLRRLLADGA